MNKWLKIILSVGAIILFAIFLGGRWAIRSLKKKVDTSLEKKTVSLHFLNDIDFDNGNYVLILEVKDKGKFWIDDKTLLKANKDSLKINVSLFNYLPGEGYRGYGAMLFKDRQVIKSKHGGVFNTFEYGNLLENAQPFDSVMVHEYYYESRKELEKLNLDSLQNSPDAFGLQIPEFDSINYNYQVKVTFPSVAVPVHYKEDTPYHQPIVSNDFDKDAFGRKLNDQLKNDLSKLPLSNYRFKNQPNKNAWQSNYGSILYLYDKNTGREIRKNSNPLWIDNFVLENYEIEILCDKESLEQLKAHDWSKYIPTGLANHEALFKSVNKKYPHWKPAAKTVEIEGLQENLTIKSGVFEQKYELRFIRKK